MGCMWARAVVQCMRRDKTRWSMSEHVRAAVQQTKHSEHKAREKDRETRGASRETRVLERSMGWPGICPPTKSRD